MVKQKEIYAFMGVSTTELGFHTLIIIKTTIECYNLKNSLVKGLKYSSADSLSDTHFESLTHVDF